MMRTRLSFRRVTGALLSLALFTGCADKITGPQAVEMLTALERQHTAEPELDHTRFWDRLGGWQFIIDDLRNASIPLPTVRVRRGGESIHYRAVVFERLMDPPTGFAPDDRCFGPRWSLVLWQDEYWDAIVMMGGNYRKRLQRGPGVCPDIGFYGPEPFAWAGRWVPSADTSRTWRAWISEDGRGDISPGVVVGACTFMKQEDADWLLQEMGARCQITRHTVSIDAQMEGIDWLNTPAQRLPIVGPPGFSMRLAPVEVFGVRWTFDCTLEAAGCYREYWPDIATEDSGPP